MQNLNRLKLVRFTSEFIGSILTNGNELTVRVESGLPPDAVMVGSGYDPVKNTFYLIIHSESFPETVAGNPLEEFGPVVFHRIYTPKEGVTVVHAKLKQCCGCHAIWPVDKIAPHNECPNCKGQCGGLRV